jgi:hypothetical protein
MNVIAVPVTTLVATMRVPIRVDVMKDIDSKEIQFVLILMSVWTEDLVLRYAKTALDPLSVAVSLDITWLKMD